MYDDKNRTHVTFNARVLPVSSDPDTYKEHLEFAAWYQMVSSSRRSSGGGRFNRFLIRSELREELARYSLMELRAIFVFSVFENKAEIEKGDTLNILERVTIWEMLHEKELVDYSDIHVPRATDLAEEIKYDL